MEFVNLPIAEHVANTQCVVPQAERVANTQCVVPQAERVANTQCDVPQAERIVVSGRPTSQCRVNRRYFDYFEECDEDSNDEESADENEQPCGMRVLSLSGCVNITCNVENFDNNDVIEVLNLDRTNTVGDVYFFSWCSNLQKLNLSNTEVTGDVIAFHQCKKLVELNLHNTKVYGDMDALRRELPHCNIIV
jgi:hypothetical protein